MKTTQQTIWNRSRNRYKFTTDYAMPSAGISDPYAAMFDSMAGQTAVTAQSGSHPLHDAGHNQQLLAQENDITLAFEAIEPVLREISAKQWQNDFIDSAQSTSRHQLGFELPAERLKATWTAPLNIRALYAECVFRTFNRLAQREFDRSLADQFEGEPAEELIHKWGFHAIDITPCADGRLSGVVDYILRIPPNVVAYRKSFAGSMFDVEESMRNWTEIELRRFREGKPNNASEPTRYLKIGVYHASSSDPAHEGCAAHGSNEHAAASALLNRLNEFTSAIENSHCCAASVATLLIGVDTDTDAIKVHIPDANGVISLEHFIDNKRLFDETKSLSREEAKQHIRASVAQMASVSLDDEQTEGMRWFCGYLLKNNMAQIEYVQTYHNGRYADLGHTERFITVGDSFDDIQLRNLAYQAQMETVEEGAADMDVGIKIFRKVNMARGLPIPVVIHFRYDGRVPGSRERAENRCRRLCDAIESRYPDLSRDGWLYTFLTIKDRAPGSQLEYIHSNSATERHCACGCNKAESKQ